MKKKIFTVLMVGILGLFSACGGGEGGDSTVLKKIVFEGTAAASKSDIYMMNEDGSGIVNLTNTADYYEYNPEWSPDGTKIFFIRDEGTKYYLYVMNVDVSNQTKITTQEVIAPSYWDVSPDGSKIAFTSNDGTDNEIYVVNVDGTGLVNFSNNDIYDNAPGWSPDGQWLAWVVRQGSDYDLYKKSLDGSSYLFITEGLTSSVTDTKLHWSPDGQRLAFTQYGNFWMSDNYELFIINNNGQNFTNISNNSKDDITPLWSPDGTKIAFVSKRDDNYNIYLWTGSSIVTQLTDSAAEDKQHSWTPDGTKIVFVSDRDVSAGRYQIYVMNADGGNQTRLTFDDTMTHANPKWQP
jgi:Tol biopolymer transport system component